MGIWNATADNYLSQILTDFQVMRTRYSSVTLMTNFNSFLQSLEALNQMKIFEYWKIFLFLSWFVLCGRWIIAAVETQNKE